MRGIYTAGVLDFFMEQNLYTDGVIGVSAGACHACSYVSKQIGRAYRTLIHRIQSCMPLPAIWKPVRQNTCSVSI